MKNFGTRFLETVQDDKILDPTKWTWTPHNTDIKKIYASGNKTATRSSTYAAEKDNENDSDRPNEGA